MQERFHQLDGLRGLAATIVVVAHAFQFFLPAVFSPGAPDHLGEAALATTPLNLLFNGGFAVCLFFVLSGFVLAMPWFARRDARWYVVAALKRYPRLALPALASTVFAVVLAKSVGFHYAEAQALTGATMPDFFSDIESWTTAVWQGSVGAFFFGEDTYNRVLWTIRVELIGSMGVFALVPVLGRFRARWIAYVALSAWLADTFYLGFVLGVLIADVVATWRPAPLRPWAWMPLAGVGVWLGAYPYVDVTGTIWAPVAVALRGIGEPFMLSHTLGAACWLVVALRVAAVKSVLVRAPLRYLGRISYAMYLVHFPLMAAVGCGVVVLVAPVLGYPVTAVGVMGVLIAVTIGVADLFCRWVDGPVLEVCDGLGSRLSAALLMRRRANVV